MRPAPLFLALLAIPATPLAARQERPAPEGIAPSRVKQGVEAWERGNYTGAVALWRDPAESGDADAQFNLGQAYKLGRGVPVDLKAAEDWYGRAARQGHAQAATNYGLALFANGKREVAVPYLRKSALEGDPRAQYVLGTMHFNGDQVPKDWVSAYALIVRSSQSGLSEATNALAQMEKYITAEDRRNGLALAKRLEQGEGLEGPLPAPVPGPVAARSSAAPARPVLPTAAGKPRVAPSPLAAAPQSPEYCRGRRDEALALAGTDRDASLKAERAYGACLERYLKGARP